MCFARWCHIVASNQELSDLRTLYICSKLCCELCSRTCSSFSKRVICLPTWPNSILFQWAKRAMQLSRQLVIGTPIVLYKPSLQAFWTTSTHRGSLSHIASKWNGRWVRCYGWCLWGCKCIASMEWSLVDIEMWWMVASWKRAFHEVVASAWSRRMWIWPLTGWFQDQVYGEPTNPKLVKPHVWMTERKRSIFRVGRNEPPLFSVWLTILL